MKSEETIIISAVRYALGRKTTVAGETTEYVGSILPRLSDECIRVIAHDIDRQAAYGYGHPCDKDDWMCLKEQLEEELIKRYGNVEDGVVDETNN